MSPSPVSAYYFSIDDDLVYEPFLADFGPLNLSCLWKFVYLLDRILADPD